MKTDMTPGSAILTLSDIKTIREFFTGGYERKCSESECDKHFRGFNHDRRFSGTGEHSLSFDSCYGYFGNSSCKTFLCITNKAYFWECFDAWLNSNMKTVMMGVANEMQKRVGCFRESIKQEQERMTKLLEEIDENTRLADATTVLADEANEQVEKETEEK